MESAAERNGRRRTSTVTKREITTLRSCARHLVTQFGWSTLLQQVPQNWPLNLWRWRRHASVGHPMRRSVSILDTSRREQRKTALQVATASWMRSRATLSRFGQPSRAIQEKRTPGQIDEAYEQALDYSSWVSTLSKSFKHKDMKTLLSDQRLNMVRPF